jgi:cytochrome c-type biogenesis protein CcmH/NrfG
MEANMDLKEQLSRKYEALDFWEDLIDCTREAGPKVERLEKEIEKLREEKSCRMKLRS